jgi:hypothetical protein
LRQKEQCAKRWPECRVRGCRRDPGDRQILLRVQRGGILIGEGELRYQLERKDSYPLAQADELLDVLAEIEARGLLEAELCFRLIAEGGPAWPGGGALSGRDGCRVGCICAPLARCLDGRTEL